MRRTFCFGTWIILLLWVVPVFSDILPAWGNGVIVTEPEGSASKPKPAKKTPPPKSTAPVAKKEMRQIQEPLPKINISLQQGLVLLEQRYFTRATPLLERAVLEEPGNPAAWHALGRTYHERGLFSRAQEAYKKALEAHPGFLPILQETDENLSGIPSGRGGLRSCRQRQEDLQSFPRNSFRPLRARPRCTIRRFLPSLRKKNRRYLPPLRHLLFIDRLIQEGVTPNCIPLSRYG